MLPSGANVIYLVRNFIIWDAMLPSAANVIICDERLLLGMQFYHLELMLSSGMKCYHLELILSSGTNYYHLG